MQFDARGVLKRGSAASVSAPRKESESFSYRVKRCAERLPFLLCEIHFPELGNVCSRHAGCETQVRSHSLNACNRSLANEKNTTISPILFTFARLIRRNKERV